METQARIMIEDPEYDWEDIDIELFRGPGLSYPISIQVMLSPSFTLEAMSAAKGFGRYFQGSIIDTDVEGF